jgi:hypothetical protein
MPKNPKLVVEAFLPDLLAIGEIKLRPITMGTTLVLEKIDCPLVDEENIAAAKKNKGKFTTPLSNDDIARLVYVLTHPAKSSRILLESGRQSFDAEVYDYVDRIPIANMVKLGGLITEHFTRSFSTIIGGGAEAQKKTPPETHGMNSSEATTASDGR